MTRRTAATVAGPLAILVATASAAASCARLVSLGTSGVGCVLSRRVRRDVEPGCR